MNTEKKKSLVNRKTLTSALIRNSEPKKELYSIADTEVPKLRVYVSPTGHKSFYFCYYSKLQKKAKRKKIADCVDIPIKKARDKAQQYIFEMLDGAEPKETEKTASNELTLSGLIGDYRKKEMCAPRYKPTTIRSWNSLLNAWIFGKSQDKQIREIINNNPNVVLKDKRLSEITKLNIKELHKAISLKSPITANRVVSILKIIFNYAIEFKQETKQCLTKVNPCKLKSKGELNKERKQNDVFSQDQLDTLLNSVLKYRGDNLFDFRYYEKKSLSLVSCAMIAFSLMTGRRQYSEVAQAQWSWINFHNNTLFVKDSKIGDWTYQLDPEVMRLLKTIRNHRNFKNNPFSFKNDERDGFVFQSDRFGEFNRMGKKNKRPHLTNVTKTWKKVLKMCGFRYFPLKQLRHSYFTQMIIETGDLELVSKLAGHRRLDTTRRYINTGATVEKKAVNVFAEKRKQRMERFERKNIYSLKNRG